MFWKAYVECESCESWFEDDSYVGVAQGIKVSPLMCESPPLPKSTDEGTTPPNLSTSCRFPYVSWETPFDFFMLPLFIRFATFPENRTSHRLWFLSWSRRFMWQKLMSQGYHNQSKYHFQYLHHSYWFFLGGVILLPVKWHFSRCLTFVHLPENFDPTTRSTSTKRWR